MDIKHYPSDSRMSRFWRPDDVFELYLTTQSLTPEVTLSGTEMLHLVMAHYAQAHSVLTLATRVARATEPLTHRRLLGQHKPLRALPTSPHPS